MRMAKLTICIPSYNEAENIDGLAGQILVLEKSFSDILHFLILNNGSMDNTLDRLRNSFGSLKFVSIVDSKENLGYGGGMRALIEAAKTEYVCLLPADLQYSEYDIASAINLFLADSSTEERSFIIGERSTRSDAKSQILTSKVYSWLVKNLWSTPRIDINALPKIFPREMIVDYSGFASNFVFDAQLIWIAHKEKVAFKTVPVTFHRRSAGVSSWSGKRIKTYMTVIRQLLNGPPQKENPANL
jgi:glycosyltransferase involved in cell wall biosynthesis